MRKQGDAKVDRTESSRQKRRIELLETLRRLFPGVVSLQDRPIGMVIKDIDNGARGLGFDCSAC